MSNTLPTIKFIIGSTRPNRFGPKVADWLMQIAGERTDANIELIDIKDLKLPFLDEPQTPSLAMGNYTNEHTKKWAGIVNEADGFVFITPEYNHSTSAALKNAIDYLWAEWHYKPAVFVSYGSAAGGLRAVEHLRTIAGELKMYDIRETVSFVNYWNFVGEDGSFQPTEDHENAAHALLDQLVFWAHQMKTARAALEQKVLQYV